MLALPITYENFNGETVTKEFHFNITKGELALRELETKGNPEGTWSEVLERIKNSDQGSVVVPEFKKILKWTYGERQGDSFIKNDDVWTRFENSEAWSVLIMRLLTEDGFAAEFINSLMPADMAAKNREQQAVPGFRPGVERPGPQPVGNSDAGTQSPPANSQPISAPIESEPAAQAPIVQPVTEAAAGHVDDAEDVAAYQKWREEQASKVQEQGVIRESTPREQ